MPFKDPERARAAKRASAARRRAMGSTPKRRPVLDPVRVEQARDVQRLIEEQVNAVRREPNARTLEKARVVGFLAGVALRAVEAGDLEARVEELEARINGNNEKTSSSEIEIDYGPAPEPPIEGGGNAASGSVAGGNAEPGEPGDIPLAER